MMLFLVGLELEASALWKMRHRLFGLGGLQLLLTTVAISAIALLLGQSWSISLAIGLIFSLSSTAIVLQTFNEKGLTKTDGGSSAFSVLLFQDIAVIPMLALLPLLALPELQAAAANLVDTAAQHEELSLVADLPAWAAAIVVLASSEFRHQLEADIEPFKGLLLGLFFITVGAAINFEILNNNLVIIIALTLGLMLLKALVLLVLAMVFKIRGSDRWLFFLSLAQAGEFGLVLLSYSIAEHILPEPLAQTLSIVVALSMFLAPVLFIIFDKVILPRFKQQGADREADKIDEKGKVIIAGIGRFGQVVNRLLIANNIPTVVLDYKISQTDRMRKVNIKSFYGDASRPDLLHTAGIDDASLVVVAIDNTARAIEMVKHIKLTHSHVQVLARGYDRGHVFELKEAGADYVVSELYNSALTLH
jgi:predicted Kef-type K+ transport protein